MQDPHFAQERVRESVVWAFLSPQSLQVGGSPYMDNSQLLGETTFICSGERVKDLKTHQNRLSELQCRYKAKAYN